MHEICPKYVFIMNEQKKMPLTEKFHNYTQGNFFLMIRRSTGSILSYCFQFILFPLLQLFILLPLFPIYTTSTVSTFIAIYTSIIVSNIDYYHCFRLNRCLYFYHCSQHILLPLFPSFTFTITKVNNTRKIFTVQFKTYI